MGSESGQKQSVKLLQNMVHSTFLHPPQTPEVTHCLYTVLYIGKGGRGGGGQREGTVEGQQYTSTKVPYSSFVHGGSSSQAGSKIQTIE